MYAVASATSGHDMLANKSRGRDRSASELVGPSNDDPRLPESVYLPRAASYTYFPQVKELFDEAGIVELKGTISEDELKASKDSNGDEGPYSSGGTSPEAEVSAAFERLSLQQTISRRSSRFLLFGSQNQDSPDNSPTEKLQRLSRSSTDFAKSRSPSRSFSKLKRKSWISSQSRSSSPSKDGSRSAGAEGPTNDTKNSDAGRRKSIITLSSNSEKIGSNDERDGSPLSRKGTVLTKKPKRPLSALLKGSNPTDLTPPVPALPPLPKSFSTDKLSYVTPSPTSERIPPIPRHLSSDKLKGIRTELRKKDELWNVFRALDGDLRK